MLGGDALSPKGGHSKAPLTKTADAKITIAKRQMRVTIGAKPTCRSPVKVCCKGQR